MKPISRNLRLMTPKPVKATAKPSLNLNGGNNKLFGNNKLLAGYLAHEFLTKGTLFGEVYGAAAPAGTQAVKNASAMPKIAKPNKEEKAGERKEEGRKHKVYLQVANLLKAEGTHLPGIVNPTDLARHLGM
ncbi:hypothetical protein Ancab_019711 [Ancistrocladus abbreviatus]